MKLDGLDVNESLMSRINFKQEDAKGNVKNLLALPKHEGPTTIFTANNFIGVNVIKALRHFGLDVPKDLAFVCFEDFEPISTFISASYSCNPTSLQPWIYRNPISN